VTQPAVAPQADNSDAPDAARARTRRPRWWRIAWYPVVVPVAFMVIVWSATEVHPVWLLRPLVVTTVLVLLLTLALSALLRDRDRGALAAFAVVVGLVSNDLRLTAVLLLIAWLVVAEGIMNLGRPWARGPLISRWLTITGGCLIVVTILTTVQLGSFEEAVADVLDDISTPRRADAFDPAAPNIYVVLLDGYPGDDAANLDPRFDSDAFPGALAARGFDVQRHSRSNYLLTRLTVATMFGAAHIRDADALRSPYKSLADDSRRLRRFGDDGPVLRAFAEAGYETLTIASDVSHLGLRRVDRVIDAPAVNELEGVLLRASSVGALLERFLNDQVLDMRRSNVLAAFAAAAAATPTGERPMFEWVHVMAPHAPWVFDRNGDPVNDMPGLTWQEPVSGQIGRADRIQRTFGYVEFVNERTLSLVDQLVERDPVGVIIILSDHGSDTAFDARDPLGSDLNERSSNVFASRTPGRSGLFPDGTTPINVFPRLLNAYLGTSLPIQQDTTWTWRPGSSILDAVPIDLKALQR
jgi:hypothetical protein